jgi:hypothetical protein
VQALSRLGALCEEIASLSNKGKQVMLISSGAVGLGRERIGLSKEVVKDVNNVVERQVGECVRRLCGLCAGNHTKGKAQRRMLCGNKAKQNDKTRLSKMTES